VIGGGDTTRGAMQNASVVGERETRIAVVEVPKMMPVMPHPARW
jgi:hypothetical protein